MLGTARAAGLLRRLSFGDLVLIQPEILDAYCMSLALGAREEPDGLGCISKQGALAGNFPMDLERRLKSQADERLMLVAMVERSCGPRDWDRTADTGWGDARLSL